MQHQLNNKKSSVVKNRLWFHPILGMSLSAGSFPRALAYSSIICTSSQEKSRMVDTGTPESKPEEKNSLDQTPTETRPKSECEKSKESMEMLKFFDCLSESTREEVLKILCRTGEGCDKKPKNLSFNETRSVMENQFNTETAHLYDNFMETQHEKALAKRYVGKVPSHQLQLGLQITLVSCKEKDLGEVKVILHEQDPGNDAISCKKTKEDYQIP